MYAHLIIKEKDSSVHYIQEAENYLRELNYYVHGTGKNDLGQIAFKPDAIFILTSEENSSYITDEQYNAIKEAERLNIPHFIIYKIKNSNTLNIYTAGSFRYGDHKDSNYGKLTKFTRAEYKSYTMNNDLNVQVSDTNTCVEVPLTEKEIISHTSMECDDDVDTTVSLFEPSRMDLSYFDDDEDEELLLVLY